MLYMGGKIEKIEIKKLSFLAINRSHYIGWKLFPFLLNLPINLRKN